MNAIPAGFETLTSYHARTGGKRNSIETLYALDQCELGQSVKRVLFRKDDGTCATRNELSARESDAIVWSKDRGTRIFVRL